MTPDKSKNLNKSASIHQAGGYDKLISFFSDTEGTDLSTYNSRAKVVLQQSANYEWALRFAEDGSNYRSTAGTDLSSILYPFELRLNNDNPNLPHIHEDISHRKIANVGSGIREPNFADLLPYYWVPSGVDYITDRYAISASGDSMSSTVSSNKIRGDSVDRFRDPYEIRSVGMRMPMMGVGWGYDLNGAPFPPGQTSGTFVGNVQYGSQIDPKEYIAAPIDLRYDKDRHVWAPPTNGFIVRLEKTGGEDGGLSASGLIFPTWTYTARYLQTNDIIESGLSPEMGRLPVQTFYAGEGGRSDLGWAIRLPDDDFKLLMAFGETPKAGRCA